MANNRLKEFLLNQCKQRGISLRRLSLNAGLSAATLGNIVNRKYQPTVYTLNQIADYLQVKREFLWRLAGVGDVEPDAGSEITSPIDYARVAYQMDRIKRLPDAERNLVMGIVDAFIKYLETTSGRSTGKNSSDRVPH